MKIYGTPPENRNFCNRVDKAGDKEDLASAQGAGPRTPAADKVRLSGRTRALEELRARIEDLPEIRAGLVDELKRAVESGTYEIDSYRIAGRIISEIV